MLTVESMAASILDVSPVPPVAMNLTSDGSRRLEAAV
jgi:hypothetical protein